MSAIQEIDLVINIVGFAALVWLSAAAVLRWIQTGRIESYSVDALLPKGLPSWTRWLLAPTFVVTPAPSSGPERQSAWGITLWGWICLCCFAVWLLVKVA